MLRSIAAVVFVGTPVGMIFAGGTWLQPLIWTAGGVVCGLIAMRIDE